MPVVARALFWRQFCRRSESERAHQIQRGQNPATGGGESSLSRLPRCIMQLSTDRTEILVNGKSKYSARSISFVLGTDVCVLCIASAATGSVSSQCVECGNVPKATVRTGFRLNEHRLDGKMRKPRPREVTTIEQDDFDNEAKLLFESLGLDASGQGHVHHDKYCSINQVYRRFDPPTRPPARPPALLVRAHAR